jgi:hypothetical protein
MTSSPSKTGQQPLRAAKPQLGSTFDPWNSPSTGHQRPETNPGTGWRQSRNKKLNSQYQAGRTGGERLSDTWGAGSEDWDKERGVLIPKSIRERKGRSVRDMLFSPGLMQKTSTPNNSLTPGAKTEPGPTAEEALNEERRREGEAKEAGRASRAIFDGIVVYVNGSTYPLISDHKLKHILSENGAKLSLHLGRRQVTHVIVGRLTGSSHGAGGGLAGSKLEKEIRAARGSGVKFVSAEW